MRYSFPSDRLSFILFLAFFLPHLANSQGNAPKTAQPGIVDTGAKAELFGPGVISSGADEWATSFTPDGRTVYFSRGGAYWTIVSSTLKEGKWMKAQVAPFSGRWRDTDPFVSPDGRRLFFVSNRPLEGAPQDKPQASIHIWYVDEVAGIWGMPHRLDSLINLGGVSNYAPSVSANGTLYFCSRDREGHSGMQSYYSIWQGDHYDKPQLLQIEGLAETQDPFIAPDESYLVLLSGNDIYIAWRRGNGWSAAENLGANVNNGDGNSSPYVARDGKTLYYSSNRIKGFYKRDPQHHALNADELNKENEGPFNGRGNILMIPIHLPKAS